MRALRLETANAASERTAAAKQTKITTTVYMNMTVFKRNQSGQRRTGVR
jgi:hypothetical protein